MAALRERIGRDILLLDGGTGTQLFELGLKPGDCPERANLEKPEWPEEIARRYRESGADVVCSNTFGGSPLKLAMYGLDGRCEEINRLAVASARRGAGRGAWVALSVGPCGKLLQPVGDADPQAVQEGFRRQIGAGIEAGADLVVIETMSDLLEAKLALQAARSLSAEIPLVATMTFERGRRGFFTIMGVSVARAAAELPAAGADVIGSNCGNGSEAMADLAREFRLHSRLPLAFQANAGLPEVRAGQTVYPETPGFMAAQVDRLLELGVSLIGGCCGTTPAHIAAFRSRIDRFRIAR